MRAAYDGIYNDLRSSIEQGTYQYKDYLPSESILVKRYGCAHNTVRKAIAMLARKGYVVPIHGKGVRVIYHSTPLVSNLRSCFEPVGIESFHDAGARCGFTTRTQVLSMDVVEVDEACAAETGFEEGSYVVRMHRLRYRNGEPFEREENCFRAETVQGITQKDAENSVYQYIASLGNKIATTKRVITVETANEDDQKLMHLNPGDPVAVIVSACYDGDGLLCEVTKTRHEGKTFTFSHTAVGPSVFSTT